MDGYISYMNIVLMAMLFFLRDYIYQEKVVSIIQLVSFDMMKYICMILLFWIFQWLGYIYTRKKIAKENLTI
ncbi:hypothetical protein SAMN02910398_01432 [Butyrivibrio sp. YAB3001]|nr:hypothetical protein SAMN02910398_01432 [Butyrivibrio sp. YAB3001]